MKRFNDKRKVFSLTLVGIAYALIVTPLIISNLQKQQDVRSRASTDQTVSTQSASCGVATTSTMLTIDRSGSMNESTNYGGKKIDKAKAGASAFVDLASQNPANQVGLVSYANVATADLPLTNTYPVVKQKISVINASGDTCIECAIKYANTLLYAGKRDGVKHSIVLLTDGIANVIDGSPKQVKPALAEQAALRAAQTGYNYAPYTIFVIGIGNNVNSPFLQELAGATGGQYYYTPTVDNLSQIYTQIAGVVSQGSISGYAFHDTNHSGSWDAGEPKLPNQQLQLTQDGYSTPKIVTTDATGHYLIPNLCNGTYHLKQLVQTGWQQTMPVDQNGYTISISNGTAVEGKAFGDIQSAGVPVPTSAYQPTPGYGVTPTPGYNGSTEPYSAGGTVTPGATGYGSGTLMDVTISLDGIGNRGDNTNPTNSSLSNKTPVHTKLGAAIEIDDSNNKLIAAGVGGVTYDSASGAYRGQLPISTGFPSGTYTIKIKVDGHLRKLVAGIQTITSGKLNTITPVSLVAGDTNSDNKLNILDYNLLLGCYSDIGPAADCANDSKKAITDLNDNGGVNQTDYNLFLRELSTQLGE